MRSKFFHDYSLISKCFSYPELCLLEDAINNYDFLYKVDENQLAELRRLMLLARGWAHQFARR